MERVLEKKVLFDGGEGPAKWKARGLPEGSVPDQYVEKCIMGAVNLHAYKMGRYEGGNSCEKRKSCQDYACLCGEQAEP